MSSQPIYSGKILKLRVDTVRMTDGRETTREIVEHDDCVAVIPVDDEDNVLLVEQFRLAAGEKLLEIPAGGIDHGESAETAVRRELREEIGYLPKKVVRLTGFYLSPGFSTEYLHLYLATDLKPSRLHAEDTDGIEVVRIPGGEINELIASGRIYDSKSIAGLLFYLKYREDLSCLPED